MAQAIVKCLTKHQKNYIAFMHRTKRMNQKQMADQFDVSERTINRVLNEMGLATAVPRIQGEAYHVMQLLKKHGLDLASLTKLLEGSNAKVA